MPALVIKDLPSVVLLSGGDDAETLVVERSEDVLLLAAGDDDVLLLSAGEPGPAGPAGDGFYREVVFAAALQVVIAHNFGRRPAVEILSPGSLKVSGDVAHDSVNQVRLNFKAPQAGLAILTA